MQTFLPYPDMRSSVQALDYRRLGKQRVEALQILNVLTGKSQSRGWRNHPAVLMWQSYEDALRTYHDHCLDAWEARGYRNTMLRQATVPIPQLPPWFGHPEFHASHRANLLRKDPDWYGQFGWVDDPTLPYIWPTKQSLHMPIAA